jgi:hypothetical protein
MANLFNWIKRHWALVILIIIVSVWVNNNFLRQKMTSTRSSIMMDLTGPSASLPSISNSVPLNYSTGQMASISDSSQRLVVKNTNLSLQVKDVAQAISQIETTAKSMGGFLVDSFLSKPELSASGNISVRVPENKRTEALQTFKSFGVKTVSESVYGVDVTAQYEDLQSRLEVLTKTKQKFEDILDKATAINDLLNIQQQLISLQSQIDSVKGQQKYYEQSAALTKITVYLSTDELALPYAPTNEWRPTVIFKQAVRSLVSSLRIIAGLTIWVIVYVPVIVPIVLIYLWYRRRHRV